MKRFKILIHLLLFVGLVLITTITPNYNPFVMSDLSQSQINDNFVEVSKEENQLLLDVKEKAEQYNEDPEDAYIDKVWKKTPGRNGIVVNVEESYKKIKKADSFDENKLVYETVSPKISLEDLPPSPIFRGHPEKDMVSFLINVSWGTEYIPDILNALKENKVKATFFIEGKWAKENSNLVKMIDEQGHVIGNHAYNHPDMASISKDEMYDQINQTNDILKAIIDKNPTWFAPPSGSFNQEVVKVAHQLDMETILWTVDTIDWQNPSVSVMMDRVMTKLHPGATILMHPTAPVAKGMPDLIKAIKDEGYRLGTIESLLSEER